MAENLSSSDEVYLKLNCEGCECDVLDDIIEGGQIGRIRAAMIHFDVRKVPSMRHREHTVRSRLDELGVPYTDADAIAATTVFARTQVWLERAGPGRANGRTTRLRSMLYRWRWHILPRATQHIPGRALAKHLLPAEGYRRIRYRLTAYDD